MSLVAFLMKPTAVAALPARLSLSLDLQKQGQRKAYYGFKIRLWITCWKHLPPTSWLQRPMTIYCDLRNRRVQDLLGLQIALGKGHYEFCKPKCYGRYALKRTLIEGLRIPSRHSIWSFAAFSKMCHTNPLVLSAVPRILLPTQTGLEHFKTWTKMKFVCRKQAPLGEKPIIHININHSTVDACVRECAWHFCGILWRR